MLAALRLIGAIRASGVKPSELADQTPIYPQILKNARIRGENKNNYMENTAVREEIRRIESHMAGEGRVLIRPSGTEPLVRVMLEGGDLGLISGMAQRLAELITEELG
jgi:phosphoglucosamine mutase